MTLAPEHIAQLRRLAANDESARLTATYFAIGAALLELLGLSSTPDSEPEHHTPSSSGTMGV